MFVIWRNIHIRTYVRRTLVGQLEGDSLTVLFEMDVSRKASEPTNTYFYLFLQHSSPLFSFIFPFRCCRQGSGLSLTESFQLTLLHPEPLTCYPLFHASLLSFRTPELASHFTIRTRFRRQIEG